MNTHDKITVITAQIECHMCPTIITGRTPDGWTVYCRYRWGRLSVRIDPRDPPPNGGASGNCIHESRIDATGLTGWMNFDELKAHTINLFEWPAVLTPKTYDDNDTWLDDATIL